MNYFLLVYNQRTGALVSMDAFPEVERAAAQAERFRREVAHAEEEGIEIVLLGAESEESLRETHGRYFKTVGELAQG
jgi:hypothetical protein